MMATTAAAANVLLDSIVGIYHDDVRRQLRQIQHTMVNIAGKYGLCYQQLHPIAELFVELESELRLHLVRQEQALFPWLRRSKALGEAGATPGTEMMQVIQRVRQTDSRIEALFCEIRELTGGYARPVDSCAAYRQIVFALSQLDEQTRKHFQVERELLGGLDASPGERQPQVD